MLHILVDIEVRHPVDLSSDNPRCITKDSEWNKNIILHIDDDQKIECKKSTHQVVACLCSFLIAFLGAVPRTDIGRW